MTGFNDSSDIEAYVNDPTFRAELNEACETAVKKFPDTSYDGSEELATDVLIKVCQSRTFAEYRQLTNAKGYLYAIAHNLLVNEVRSPKYLPRGREADLEVACQKIGEWTVGALLDRILADQVLDRLSGDELHVILLWMQGRTFKEIAAHFKVSQTTISVRFANIIKKIQRLLSLKTK